MFSIKIPKNISLLLIGSMFLIFALSLVLATSENLIQSVAGVHQLNAKNSTQYHDALSNENILANANSKCNGSLWKFIPTPSRLRVINPCISITGIVDVIRLHPPDGDTNLGIKLDSQYNYMLTKANYSNKLMHGDMWIEMICQHKNVSDNPIKKGGCKGYSGPHFIVPAKGEHVKITGSYVLDIREGGHAEIHPVTSINVIR
jgi:hypothetical protein